MKEDRDMPVRKANVITTLKPQSFVRLPHSQGNYGNQVLAQEGGRAPLWTIYSKGIE